MKPLSPLPDELTQIPESLQKKKRKPLIIVCIIVAVCLLPGLLFLVGRHHEQSLSIAKQRESASLGYAVTGGKDSGISGDATDAMKKQAANTDQATTGTSTHTVSLSALPLGDKKTVTSPRRGYIYPCQTQFNGSGAFQAGPWINQTAGTWDQTKKIAVSGTKSWSNAKWSVTSDGTTRVLTTNDIPYHTTGTFPILTTDPAYQYDRNPNSIKEQSLTISLPADPTLLATPECVGGEVGIMLSGVPLFNGFDAGGRDAEAWEIQDNCGGHPQEFGMYHYHGPSKCLKDATGVGEHSALEGYALDGFGIYGVKGEGGKILTSADLDECHGHTHEIMWDGKKVVMYHYHLTYDFPYSVGCLRAHKAVTGPLGGTGQSNQTGQGQQAPSGTQMPMQQSGSSQPRPPRGNGYPPPPPQNNQFYGSPQ